MRIEKTEQGKTKNGLRYYLFPRTSFGEQMAAVLVQRGANHLFWKGRDGEKICFPQGTAHFIEHKLFQQEWGDAFACFTQNGESANAFTDGDRTVYYFTCSDKFTENLRLLLDFVQKPYFTKEDTEREKDIIVSEITMYEDDPMWVGYYQMLECMYGKHPIRNRIAGTAETVAEITAEGVRMLLHNGRNGTGLCRGYPFGRGAADGRACCETGNGCTRVFSDRGCRDCGEISRV